MALSESDKAVLLALREYPLEPGDMLLFGPLSVAYISGDHTRAPWLFAGVKPPGGVRLPDKHIIKKDEWNAT